MIHDTLKFVEDHYSVKNGHPWNADVIYGDTDSVMVRFGEGLSIEQSMDYGKAAAELITEKLFIKPIMLEFEKVYKPYLLMNKKRYAGMLWTKPSKWDYMDAKGIETVRRDNCPLVKHVVQQVLNLLLIEENKEKAIDFARR